MRPDRIAGDRARPNGNGKDADRPRARLGGGAGGQRLIGVEHKQVCAVHGDSKRIDARRVHGVLRIDLAVVADDELDDGIVVLVHHVEIGVVGRHGLSHRIPAAGRKRRGGDVAHGAGFGVDLKNVKLPVAVGSRSLGTGHEDDIHGKRLTGGHQSSHQEAGRGDQQKLARFVELHAHLSSANRNPVRKNLVWNRTPRRPWISLARHSATF
jgi:hypothetical protein